MFRLYLQIYQPEHIRLRYKPRKNRSTSYSKPIERKSILEEAAGISGIHARRQEAETRLNAAENNLKRADELKRQQEKQLDNLKKQAEEATRYKEISKEIKKLKLAFIT